MPLPPQGSADGEHIGASHRLGFVWRRHRHGTQMLA